MFTKSEIIENYINVTRSYDFFRSELIVLFGGSLVLHDFKYVTSNLNLVTTSWKFAELINDGYKPIQIFKPKLIDISAKYIQLNKNIKLFSSNLKLQSIEHINYIPCQSLNHLLTHKLLLNRLKDQRDIDLLEKYLNKQLVHTGTD